MQTSDNKGFDPQVIEEYRNQTKASGQNFILDDEDERSDE